GADRPAPDVHLVPAGAAEVDAGVGVRQGQAQLLAPGVAGVRAVGQDVQDARVDVGSLLDAPVHAQDEVAELPLGPQALGAPGLAPGVVVDDAVDDLPVPAVPLGPLPAAQVLAVEQGREPSRGSLVSGAQPQPAVQEGSQAEHWHGVSHEQVLGTGWGATG